MAEHPRGSRWWLVVVAVGALASLSWFVVDHAFSIYDDAYIYFRYADNLRNGCGPTFNCGDPPVEGFTSPLFLALLWAGGLLTDDVEAWSQVLGPLSLALAMGLSILVVVQLAPERLRPVGAVSVAMILALDHHVLLNAVSGLETGLAAAAVVGLSGAVLRRDGRRTVAWVLVGVLLRPECGVFVLLLPLLPWMRTRRSVAVVLGTLVGITAIRYAVFGDVLPNTFWAKSGGTSVHARLGWAYLGECIRTFPQLLFVPLLLAGGGDEPQQGRRREAAYLVLGMALWLAAFLRTGGDHFAYARLAFPLVPAATALGVLGVAHLPRGSVRIRGVVIALVAIGLSAHAVLQHRLPPAHGFRNVERWAAVGDWLRTHHPGATIATVPVGAMAYRSELRTLDLVGITSAEVARAGGTVPPELLDRGWLGHERHATEWVLEQAPDLIVSTKFRDTPWRHLGEAKAGFYADWLLLQEIKAGQAPYVVLDAEVQPGLHWLMYRRVENR